MSSALRLKIMPSSVRASFFPRINNVVPSSSSNAAICLDRVDKITRGQIQAFIDDLARNGKNFLNGQPLYRKTIIHHLNLLSDVFNYAIRLEMIEDNPSKNIFVPKGRKKEKEIYTVEEMKQLFALAEEYGTLDYRAFLTLAVYSGFRSGELMGLEWKDIDWDNNVINVRRTANYTATDGTYTDTPKTKKSVRSLKLPDVVFDRLRELRTQQLDNKEIFGTKWESLCTKESLTSGRKSSQRNTA